jgi:hypothetical protein
MPTLLDLDTLTELYPDPDGRRQFLLRAIEILHNDRLALEKALTDQAYAQASELAHRLQGTAAFMTGDPTRPADMLLPLSQAIKQRNLADMRATQTEVLHYLIALESAMEQLANPR